MTPLPKMANEPDKRADDQPDGAGWISMWLPKDLKIMGGQVVEGFQSWSDCETWWLIEHIDRVASLPFIEPDGPKCDLIRLAELDFGDPHGN